MRIEHIALYVQDLEAARRFFTTYFQAKPNDGYHNEQTGLRTYFLTLEGGARLELMTRPNLAPAAQPHPHGGFAHLAFTLGSRGAVDVLTERLRADGYAVQSGPRVTGDGYYESCVLGPEGCVLELTA
jgi:lactoylglutathione lyase